MRGPVLDLLCAAEQEQRLREGRERQTTVIVNFARESEASLLARAVSDGKPLESVLIVNFVRAVDGRPVGIAG